MSLIERGTMPETGSSLPLTEREALQVVADSLTSWKHYEQGTGVWQFPTHDGPAVGDIDFISKGHEPDSTQHSANSDN